MEGVADNMVSWYQGTPQKKTLFNNIKMRGNFQAIKVLTCSPIARADVSPGDSIP